MSSTERCNCEAGCCEDSGAHVAGSCPTVAEGSWRMDFVGAICDACAARIVAAGGGAYVHPIHHPTTAELLAERDALDELDRERAERLAAETLTGRCICSELGATGPGQRHTLCRAHDRGEAS